ncbi:MAG TPA: BON domain-containing protein, partial [Gemmataceae bacterium]|nr:BON domain-containing protein [Gemmataceae bacterium]
MATQSRICPIGVRAGAVRGGWLGLPRGLLVLLFLGGAGILRAGAADTDLRDLQHEVAVRAALAKDSRLESLNLIVRVKDRVATLSGPVPTRDLARRALETAKKVPDLIEVRDKMTVQFEDMGKPLPLPTLSTYPGPAQIVQPPPAAVPPIIVPAAGNSQATPMGGWIPIKTPMATQQGPAVELLPHKVAQPGPGAGEPVSRPKPDPTGKPAEPLDAAAISSAVQSLVQGDERYRRLRYEVKQGQVYLSGVV